MAPVCYRHQDRETLVRCTRCERPICPDCMRPASVGFHCPQCVAEGRATQRRARAAFGGLARTNPEVTYTLIGVNLLAFLLTSASGSSLGFNGGVSSLFQRFALQPCAIVSPFDGSCQGGVAHGEYYRLLTSMFLHFGILHIALNMYALFLFGPHLEQAMGRLRFSALYLLSGLSGAALSYALGPATELGAGASGAIFGLFAGAFVLGRQRGADVSQIGVMIGLNLFFSFAVPNIDWHAHVGGLIGGALVTAVMVYAPSGKQRSALQALGTAAVALLVVGTVVARTIQLTG